MSTEGKGLTVLPQTGKVQGFIKIELIDKKTGSRRIMELNQVTDLGRGVITALGVGIMLSRPQNNVRGNILVDVPFIKLPNVTGEVGNMVGGSSEMTCYLVNTSEVLNAQSNNLPIYTSDFTAIDNTKLIGYGNNNLTPVDTRNGVRTDVIDTYAVASMDVLLNQWVFDATQAVGTFNKILMGPGSLQATNKGIVLARGLNPTKNSRDNNRARTYFIPPGVSGLTSVDEVLISVDDITNYIKSNAVLNLTTGAVTMLEDTDPRYGVEMIGDTFSATKPVASAYVNYNGVLYFNTSEGFFKYNGNVKQSLSSSKTSYNNEYRTTGLLKGQDVIYFVATNGTVRSYNVNTGVIETVVLPGTITTNYFKQAGTTNDAFAGNRIIQLSDGSYLITPLNSDETYGVKFPFRFTDLSNIEGSIVERVIPQYENIVGDAVVGGNTLKFLFYVDDSIGQLYTSTEGANTSEDRQLKNNLFIVNNSMGNLISYVQLDSPITKTNEQIMYVGYGYRILSQ